jgi:hypothetical protein
MAGWELYSYRNDDNKKAFYTVVDHTHWVFDGTTFHDGSPFGRFDAAFHGPVIHWTIAGHESDGRVSGFDPANMALGSSMATLARVVYDPTLITDHVDVNYPGGDVEPQGGGHESLATMVAFTRKPPFSNLPPWNDGTGTGNIGPVTGTTISTGAMDWVRGLGDPSISRMTLNILTRMGDAGACTPGTYSGEGIPLQKSIWNGNPVIIQARVRPCGGTDSGAQTVLVDVRQVSNDGDASGNVALAYDATQGLYGHAILTKPTGTGGLASGTYHLPFKINGAAQASTIDVTVDDFVDTLDIVTTHLIQRTDTVTTVEGVLGPNDADVFKVMICIDPGDTFVASTANRTDVDTQLFLFDSNGIPIVCNDDISDTVLQSRVVIPYGQIPNGNMYYLAITAYNKDAVWRDDSVSPAVYRPLFYDTFVGQTGAIPYPHDPDDPPPSFFRFKDGLGNMGGPYRIGIRGLCTETFNCADFNCDGDVGTDADVADFFACLSGTCPPPPCTNSADFNHDGDVGTDADIFAFFRALAGTCP